jgi:Tfp pilus assembly protein PilV
MSLVELMIAMLVLLVGGTGATMMMILAMGHNTRSRQQSNSIAIAQMVAEEIASVPAKTAVMRTIVDCTNNMNSVTTAAGGSAVLPSGDIDFSGDGLPDYSMLYTACGTNGTQMTYDVRWNIQSLSPYVKLVTVSAKMNAAGTDVNNFSLPVTIREQVGQGN